MPYIVLFTDNPGHDETRQQHMPAHLAFLETHQMLAAGPLFDGDTPQGGLWLVEANTPAEVEALIKADPFFATGLRKSWDILDWRQVLRDGARLI